MKKLVFIALSVASLGLALSGCAGRYYDRYGYYDRGYYDRGYVDRYEDRYYRDRDDYRRDYRDTY